MPAKKQTLSDAERAKRMRALGREAEADNDPTSFDRAFDAVVKAPKKSKSKTRGKPPPPEGMRPIGVVGLSKPRF